ncbi:hypothetical protein OIDMADRAFT_155674 [Oidiodendron maius Zn]|uniref:Uncharacterized protein n=1 Tax=Oidiodendron maius (strain Zn) TaxID=913774 RepID=A0A0C3DWJ8_OIDMZ|nr:hypothetical protein OIDMADRAFT_155674 [Oidiodendron maius Zn]
MSGGSNFLAKQKKADLADLAGSLGLEHDGLKKAELELELENYLTKNSAQYSSDSRFTSFYKRRSDSSPVKKEASSTLSDVDSKTKPVRRRVTKAAEDIGATDDSEVEPTGARARSALTRTPRASALSNLSFASSVPLPPSPAVVAEAIDRRTQVLRSKVSDAFDESGIVERAHATRESLSTVASVESLIILFELYFLRPELLSDRYAFTIPAISLLKTPDYAVKIPDLFLLLTSSFWGPASLWAVTTFFIPLIAAYFVNLTSKPKSRSSHTHFNYAFDPLTFNIVKALLTYVVFGQDVTFGGFVNLEHVARINSALYGGYQGVLVGTGIGTLITLYEAVIRK